jgi:hypothetical protein
MSARGSTLAPPEFAPPVEKLNLIAAVAYALWEDRKRHQMPDDPEADWHAAERLIEDLWNYRSQHDRSQHDRPQQDDPGRR